MITLTIDMNAATLVENINANLQEMELSGSVAVTDSATGLVDALNTAFDGLEGAKPFSIDDSATALISKLNDNFAIEVSPVAKRFRTELADTISKVNALDDEDGLVVLLSTDIHYNCSEGDDVAVDASRKVYDDSMVNMKALMEDVDADAVLCLGDIIEGSTSAATSEDEAEHIMEGLAAIGMPLLIALGNHDNNRNGYGSSYPVLSRSQMKTMFMDYVTDMATFAEPSYKSDYYIDYSAYNLRMIFIYGNADTNGGYLYNTATRTFLQTSLASLPNGYKAIVITHVPPMTKMNYNNRSRPGGENIPSGESVASIKDIILGAGDKFVAMFYGHCHQDNVWADPFVCIGTCCNKSVAANGSPSYWSEDAVMPLRNASNYTQDLWDVVLVKPTSKVIEMVRFGAGADRTIHYEHVECAAGSSVTLTSKISGGTWGLRTSDQSKASVANGVVTVNDDIVIDPDHDTLISVWCKSSDWAVNSNKQLTAGSQIEYWTIKVINT